MILPANMICAAASPASMNLRPPRDSNSNSSIAHTIMIRLHYVHQSSITYVQLMICIAYVNIYIYIYIYVYIYIYIRIHIL